MSKFFLPPEWHEQESVWLSWPHNSETWTEQELVLVENEYASFVKEILEVIKVNLLVKNEKHLSRVSRKLNLDDTRNLNFLLWETDDAWMRDYGPDFVLDKDTNKKIIFNWGYNSWGGKYPPYNLDNSTPRRVADYLNLDLVEKDLILEGGSFEVNGEGDLLTTKSCLLNKNRNPSLTQDEIENNLREAFDVEKIHWLTEGISGDDTDGHIDDVARFIGPDTIAYISTNDENHPDFLTLKNIEAELMSIVLNSGKKPVLIKLPVPKQLLYNGDILPCSYANFLITNKKVLVPTFNCLEDKLAISTLQKFFKDREVVGVSSRHIIIGLGSLHCLSKHEFKLV